MPGRLYVNHKPSYSLNPILPHRSPYILLADDDKDDCILFREALREVQIDVHFSSVDNGESLIGMLETATILPDLIFLDINMPYKNGIECLNEIRRNKSLSELIVIVYSTSSHHLDVDECYKAGANLYLEKPYSFSGLTDVLSRLMSINWADYRPQPFRENFVFKNEQLKNHYLQ